MDPSRVSRKLNAEICFKSSDNVLFFIHRNRLKYSAARFPVSKFKDKIVPLTETSEVLGLLFPFLHPNPLPPPDVRNLSIETLASLADAAEKYKVFSAIMTCNMRMTVVVNDNPFAVLRYAVIHHYKELLNVAAPLSIHWPFHEVVKYLPPNTLPAWMQYYQQWMYATFLVNVHRPECCLSCLKSGLPQWQFNVQRIRDSIPPFSELLYPDSSS